MFKFSENETVESLDSVPENLRGLYAQGDGGYSLADNMRSIAEAFDGINTANQAIRRENKALKVGKVDLSALSAYGDTPESIAEAVGAKITELSDIIDSKKSLVNPEKIRDQMTKGFEETKRGYEAKLDAYKSQLYDLSVKREALAAVAAEKGDTELLMPFITQQVRMVEEDGKLFARVMDEDGEARLGAMGSPMTVSELVKSMKLEKKYSKLFESAVTPGGGTPPGRSKVAGPGVKTTEMSAVQNIRAGLEKRGLR